MTPAELATLKARAAVVLGLHGPVGAAGQLAAAVPALIAEVERLRGLYEAQKSLYQQAEDAGERSDLALRKIATIECEHDHDESEHRCPSRIARAALAGGG